MTPRQFLHSHPGKGTVAVALAVPLIVWPPSLSWCVAAALIVYGGYHLRCEFARLAAPVSSAVKSCNRGRQTGVSGTASDDGQGRDLDMNKVMAAVAASSQRPSGKHPVVLSPVSHRLPENKETAR
jgi:hypothetical protein